MEVTSIFFAAFFLILVMKVEEIKSTFENNPNNKCCMIKWMAIKGGRHLTFEKNNENEEIYLGGHLAVINCNSCGLTSDDLLQINETTGAPPQLILSLDLGSNRIDIIKSETFKDCINLEVIDLSNNELEVIEDNAFAGLTQLRNLTLAYNMCPGLYVPPFIQSHITIKKPRDLFYPMKRLFKLDLTFTCFHVEDIQSALYNISSTTEVLNLDRIFNLGLTSSLWILDANFTRSLAHTQVKTLSMQDNYIVCLKYDAVCYLKHLEFANFRGNRIGGDIWAGAEALSCMENLTFLDIGGTHTQYMATYNRKLKELNVTNYYTKQDKTKPNILQTLSFQDGKPNSNSSFQYHEASLFVYGFPKLKVVHADHIITDDFLLNFKLWPICWKDNKLEYVNLQYTLTRELLGTVLCMEHLKYLNLEGIHTTFIDPHFFDSMKNLETLILAKSSQPQTFQAENAAYMFRNNINLKNLDLSQNNLQYLPSNMFSKVTKLRSLSLAKNNFHKITFDISPMVSLEIFDLSFNNFNLFNKAFIDQVILLKSNVTIILEGTVLYCHCTVVDMMETLDHSPYVHIANSTKQSLCMLSNGTKVTFAAATKYLQTTCNINDHLIIIGNLYLTAILVTTTATIFFRYRLHVAYGWYSVKGMITFLLYKTQDKDEHIYDAFIMCSSKDIHWITQQLLPKLGRQEDQLFERKPPINHLQYKFCIAEKDFVVGEEIFANVVSAIKHSHSLIIFVTKNFIKSHWCNQELRLAVGHAFYKASKQRLIFVMDHRIMKRRNKLPAHIQDIVSMVTCLEWHRGKGNEKLFWLKLQQALGKPIKNNDKILHDIITQEAQRLF